MQIDSDYAHKAQDSESKISVDDYPRFNDYMRARLAEIDENYKINGDAKACDAATNRLVGEREARAAAGIFDKPLWDDPPHVADDDQLVLGDLEVGDGESDAAVIETLGELDASAEDAVEGAIAKAEAYEDQPAGVAVTAPVETTTAEPDDKTRTDDSDAEALDWSVLEAAIAKAESSEVAAAREAFEREWDAAIAKAESSEAATPATASPTEPLDFECPDPIADLEIIRKRVPWSVQKRRYDKMDKQAYRARRNASQQRWRAGQNAKQPPRPPNPPRFPVKAVTAEMEKRFAEYVSRGDTHLARSLRGRFRVNNLIIALTAYLYGAVELGRDPTHNEFAKGMAWKPNGERKARRTVTVLSKVFAEGGFGTDAELAKWTAEMAKAEAAEWAWASTRGAGAAS